MCQDFFVIATQEIDGEAGSFLPSIIKAPLEQTHLCSLWKAFFFVHHIAVITLSQSLYLPLATDHDSSAWFH